MVGPTTGVRDVLVFPRYEKRLAVFEQHRRGEPEQNQGSMLSAAAVRGWLDPNAASRPSRSRG